MDRLLQGIDEETGQPFVLFGKVKVQTLPGGRWRVEDQGEGGIREFASREEALKAAGVQPETVRASQLRPYEQPFTKVRSLISEVELSSLRRIADREGLTVEAAIRRAIAAYIVAHDLD